MPWLTPDDAIGSLRVYRVFVPYNLELEGAYRGNLLDLERPSNWEKNGSQSVETVVNAWSQANDLNLRMLPMLPVGTVVWGAYTTPPEGWLICDGASYAAADYPDLFAAIGYVWGGSGANFNVPNLARRFAVGSGSGFSLGDTGGTETETLTENQIPSHDHSIPGTITTLNEIPIGTTPILSPNPISSNTGNTGGGQSHNNMPPYAALTPVISYL